MREGWSRKILAGVIAAAGLFTVGCGTYEPEPEYPQNTVQYVQAPPPSATDPQVLAQQQQAEQSPEVAIGVDQNEEEYPDTDPSALTEFKPVLEGHGNWVEDPTYGTVWVPAQSEVGTDFEPYVSSGHWTYSDETDYVWVSDYSWGWAPFHYGRWAMLPGYGWSWFPGRRYSGAWVNWRYGAGYDYVGWAPMAPSWYWYHGAPYGWSFGWYNTHPYYAFCERGHMYGGAGYVVRGPSAAVHMGRTGDYVPARPTVGGPNRVVAHPVVGPRPHELGNANVVVAPPHNNAGIARATAYASPRTAVVAGAMAPAHYAGRAPASAAMVPHASATNAVATGPRYTEGGGRISNVPSRSVATPSVGYQGGGYQGVRPVAAQGAPSRTVPQQPSVVGRPSVGSSPVVGRSAPAVHATPSVSSPAMHSSPVVRSSSSPSISRSAPAHVAAPSVSHSSGGGGGHSFGGGGHSSGGHSSGGGGGHSGGGGGHHR